MLVCLNVAKAMVAKAALVFDLDGVIIDSNPVHTQAWRAYLCRYGIHAGEIEGRMHGKRNDEIVRDFFGPLDLEQVFAHGAAKEQLFRQLMACQLQDRLVPGVSTFLDRHRHETIGLASNAEPANVDFVLDGASLRPYFKAVVDGHQVERPKPDPEIYLRIAKLLAVAPHNCIVFEDSPAGIDAARAAGSCIVAVVPDGAQHPHAELTIRDFRAPELEKWLFAHLACS